jgi:hypothetical protein
MAQGEDFNFEFGATATTGAKGREQRNDNGRNISQKTVSACGCQLQRRQQVPSFW